jgi:RNA polymerase sigma factor (sigma-70 family)
MQGAAAVGGPPRLVSDDNRVPLRYCYGVDEQTLFAEAYYPRIMGMVRASTRPGTDYDALVQEAFARLFKKWSAAPIEHPVPYLYAITRNLMKNHFRDEDLNNPRVDRPPAEWVEPVAAEAGPELVAETNAVRASIDALPPAQAEAIRLRVIDGYSSAEVAERLGSTPGAVRSAVHQGRETLRFEWLWAGFAFAVLVGGIAWALGQKWWLDASQYLFLVEALARTTAAVIRHWRHDRPLADDQPSERSGERRRRGRARRRKR